MDFLSDLLSSPLLSLQDLRVEAIASRLEASALRLEAIAISLQYHSRAPALIAGLTHLRVKFEESFEGSSGCEEKTPVLQKSRILGPAMGCVSTEHNASFVTFGMYLGIIYFCSPDSEALGVLTSQWMGS